MSDTPLFLTGVIEGFYGPPWTQTDRIELFRWMAGSGLNTYLYGPKDDLKHRALWREGYTPEEAAAMGELIRACRRHGLEFIYALGPGLDIRYTSASDLERLKARFEQMLQLGCRNFCLLFDDIPDRMDPADLERWDSLAAAQCAVTNELFQWTRERSPKARFFFCPTPYCGRMAERQLGGAGYLEIVGRKLIAEIDIFWTGPEIISREISVSHVTGLQIILRRRPIIWDNLHANDYDGRRCFCGPYAGRSRELRSAVNGLLINPNVEFPLNFVALHTFGAFLQGTGPWDPRMAYLMALTDWLHRYETVTQQLPLEDLIRFADCHYLPYEEGATAEELQTRLRQLILTDPADWGTAAAGVRADVIRLRDFCARLAELKHRPLFYAWSRRAWELREELDLLDRYLAFKSIPANHPLPFRSDFHLPKTYRGGMVARLQQLLQPQGDETLHPTIPSWDSSAFPPLT